MAVQSRGNGDRVGDDRQLAITRKHLGEGQRRRSRVEQDGAFARELVQGAGGDPQFLLGELVASGGQRWFDFEPFDGQGSTMDAAQNAETLERREVAAHGLGSDLEGLGQGRDLHSAVGSRRGQDGLLTFWGIQRGTLLVWARRRCRAWGR